MDEELIDAQTPLEYAVGGWAEGRWAWQLDDVVRVDPPVPVRGRQGLFDITVHDVGLDAWHLIETAVARG
jgi:hypothetical protein